MKRLSFLNITRNSFAKKIAIPFFTLSLFFCLTGCNDLLNEPNENTVIVEEIDYSLTANVKLPILGLYGQFYTMGWELYPAISVRGDDVNSGGLGDQPEFIDFDNFKYRSTFWMGENIWSAFYKKIMLGFSTIDEINQYKAHGANAKEAEQYIAEAKTIQAFLLFQIARIWNDVLILETANPTDIFQISKLSTKAEVMKYISDKMDEVIPVLPDMHPKERTDITGGVTKYTALAIKALANLEMKNYQGVADATSAIIKSGKFQLEPDFYELFYVKKGKLNKENLLEWQYSDFGQSTGDQKSYNGGGFFTPQGWSPKVSSVGGGWGFYEPSLKYIKFMLDRNESIRLQTTVLFTNRGITEIKKDPKYTNLPSWISNVTRSGDKLNDFARAMFSSGKHVLPSDQQTPGRNNPGANKNFICIRYAEILLMHAEALTQGASSSSITALEAVNLIRERASMPKLSTVNLSVIMDEKFAELAAEWGTRYYDLIRWEKYDELSYDGRVFTKNLSYLPYPQTQVDLLPILREKK